MHFPYFKEKHKICFYWKYTTFFFSPKKKSHAGKKTQQKKGELQLDYQ